MLNIEISSTGILVLNIASSEIFFKLTVIFGEKKTQRIDKLLISQYIFSINTRSGIHE